MVSMSVDPRVLFDEWRAQDPGCEPSLTAGQLQRVLCFAEYYHEALQAAEQDDGGPVNSDELVSIDDIIVSIRELYHRVVFLESGDAASRSGSAEVRAKAEDLLSRLGILKCKPRPRAPTQLKLFVSR
jgi:hypothetical protein